MDKRRLPAARAAGDLVGAAFYGAFLYRFVRYYAASHRLIGILFAAQLAAAALVFLVRRRARTISHDPFDYVIALAATVVPLLVRPASYRWGWQLPIGAWMQAVAIVLWAWSFAALGRSFGIVAADRGVKTAGPYRMVRHPLYLSYMVGEAGYLFQSFSLLNVTVVVVGMFLSVVRMLIEERYLASTSERYRDYARRVRWHILPGLW